MVQKRPGNRNNGRQLDDDGEVKTVDLGNVE